MVEQPLGDLPILHSASQSSSDGVPGSRSCQSARRTRRRSARAFTNWAVGPRAAGRASGRTSSGTASVPPEGALGLLDGLFQASADPVGPAPALQSPVAVTRPSSSVILPFIVCAWFLMVRETVMARPRCCPVDGSRGGWARREGGMLRWLFVCRCPNRPVLATPHHRGSPCPRPRPTHPGPRSNVCRTVRSRPVAPSAPAPPPQGYDGTSSFPPDGPAPPRSGGEHLHVTVTAVIVVLTFVAIGLAR
jgi:hypothetical protein